MHTIHPPIFGPSHQFRFTPRYANTHAAPHQAPSFILAAPEHLKLGKKWRMLPGVSEREDPTDPTKGAQYWNYLRSALLVWRVLACLLACGTAPLQAFPAIVLVLELNVFAVHHVLLFF